MTGDEQAVSCTESSRETSSQASPVENKNPPNYLDSIAISLKETVYIHALFGALDGLSLSYSMIKYCFDILCTYSDRASADVMHEWISSPGGALVAGTEAVTLIGFSLLANIYSNKKVYKSEKLNEFQRFINLAWPYCRDGLKALKNGYKGVRATMQAFSFLAGQNVNFMIVPVGILLGGISMLNRLWYRRMRDMRKDRININNRCLKEIKKLKGMACNDEGMLVESCQFLRLDVKGKPSIELFEKLAPEVTGAYILSQGNLYYLNKLFGQCQLISLKGKQQALDDLLEGWGDRALLTDDNLDKIEQLVQHKHVTFEETLENQESFLANNKIKGLLSKVYSGIVDGMYLYMGVLGIAAFNPALFGVLAGVCVLFTAVCIATRAYEDYEEQKILKLSQANVELAKCGQEFIALAHSLNDIDKQYDEYLKKGQSTEAERLSLQEYKHQLQRQFSEKYEEFEKRYEKRNNYLKKSYPEAALSGMQNGLAAYSAVASLLFASVTIFFVAGLPFPPAIVAVAVAIGTVCLVGFTAFALIQNYREHQAHKDLPEKFAKGFNALSKNIKKYNEKMSQEIEGIKPTEIQEAVFAGIDIDRSPQFLFQEIFEVVRSFFSGVMKGQKSIDYTLNPLQEINEKGHYQDTPVMLGLAAGSVVLHSIVLALQAIMKGFGRNKDNKPSPPTSKEEGLDASSFTLPPPESDKPSPKVMVVQVSEQESPNVEEPSFQRQSENTSKVIRISSNQPPLSLEDKSKTPPPKVIPFSIFSPSFSKEELPHSASVDNFLQLQAKDASLGPM